MFIIVLGFIAIALWVMFNISLEGRKDLPTLTKIANIGNIVIIIAALAIIAKYNLWC